MTNKPDLQNRFHDTKQRFQNLISISIIGYLRGKRAAWFHNVHLSQADASSGAHGGKSEKKRENIKIQSISNPKI